MSRNISFKFAAILLVGITILIGCTPNSDDYRKHDITLLALGAKVDQDKLGLLASDYYAISIATKGQDPHGIVIPGR